jgi:hypothetical protein
MDLHVDIDLHRKRSQIAALDEQGADLLLRRVANSTTPSWCQRGQLRKNKTDP